MKKNSNIVTFTDNEKKQIKEKISQSYYDIFGEEIKLILLEQLYDKFVEELAPFAYDKGLDAAKSFFQKNVDNMNYDYYTLYKENK